MEGGEGAGCLIVVAGPSGSGKTSLVSLTLERLSSVAFSVSWTSRDPRPGEREGKEYHFVRREAFHEAVEQGRFLEHATVHGNLYGTSLDEVERLLEGGNDVLLDIDVQGAEQVRRRLAGEPGLEAVSVFIVPPGPEELERRLRLRETDSEEAIRMRLKNSLDEITRAGEFDHVLINDNLETCYEQFACIITAVRSRSRRVLSRISASFSVR